MSSKKGRKFIENFSSFFALDRTDKPRIYAVYKVIKRRKM
ncbi:hypothetical protein ANACAC_00861 [Anaerostipes caccae L1-92]|uniref:Uncharacterized protein n=1 Tax=Anaerostipes caccae (strain DSM 14662 / CCUG 47493 / JCM 13470 / NCIMB 13811 / L1-92) TaxID=411490 RepID=B0MBD4_ANACD|nr:hypothetical protein ANACAC_00861 [Anaerostipes caccae L1-92]